MQAFESGQSVVHIAKDMNRHFTTVYDWLRKNSDKLTRQPVRRGQHKYKPIAASGMPYRISREKNGNGQTRRVMVKKKGYEANYCPLHFVVIKVNTHTTAGEIYYSIPKEYKRKKAYHRMVACAHAVLKNDGTAEWYMTIGMAKSIIRRTSIDLNKPHKPSTEDVMELEDIELD